MNSIQAHRESAPEYDQQAQDWGWNPEVIFGLMYEYVNSGEMLLDIGIGTGLCSVPFHRAGLKIYGVDGSSEMLEACKPKNIAAELKQHDLLKTPLPYPDEFCHHAICGGVFHFFGDLRSFFGETARILKKGGIFGFTVGPLKVEEDQVKENEYIQKLDEASGTSIYFHSDSYIQKLLKENDFTQLKMLEFIASINPETKEEHYCRLYVGQKYK
ncbi:SAM-dependent methyltransferase [candidate division LCP-89 bacterium B3_LCP]|uniref:SAM-dependent methyltransferase n=1 Tax=candidate division LCP-89 bacterium B3_LCP TaxID=2012998 RepID=A0A532UYF6_UNCL8|nr:MAG: SAM-dependent methyltransferase [candidate division LCP-89 bacterium B3_LCP]